MTKEQKEMRLFQEHAAKLGLNMAVIMYMVEALEQIEGRDMVWIRQLAFSIALVGVKGIGPGRKDYELRIIPNKTFTGYQLLAWYYVSWVLAFPDMLSKLELPYDKEYAIARTFKQTATPSS